MLDSITELSTYNERYLLCLSIAALALNAVLCTGIRDGLPEWTRIHPFHSLYELNDQMAKLLVLGVAKSDPTQNNSDSKDGHAIPIDDLRALEASRLEQSQSVHGINNKLSRALGIAAGIAFLIVMTEKSHPWTKTFACMAQIHWLWSCNLLPRPIEVVDPRRRSRCKVIASVGFSLIGHALVWFLWSGNLGVLCSTAFWRRLHIQLLWTTVVAVTGSFGPVYTNKGAEEQMYIGTLFYHISGWVWNMLYATKSGQTWTALIGLSRSNDVKNMLQYSLAMWTFVMARRETNDNVRWPTIVLTALCLWMVVVEVRETSVRC